MLVISVSLSLTTVVGTPRTAVIASSSRATRWPDSDVSATSARQARLKSSMTHRMRNRRPSDNVSETKSSDQRWLAACGNINGARIPSARLRPPRRRTCSRSSR